MSDMYFDPQPPNCECFHLLFWLLNASVAQRLADLAQTEVRVKMFKYGGLSATNECTWSTARFWLKNIDQAKSWKT